ncbi:hypothetical protein GCM10010207_51960 [Streptomyces atratus]|nr:hypothetical protein GCM10010207_51960 [Streptomyces atratus]
MQTDPAASRTDVPLQGLPLVRVQQVTRLRCGVGVVEHDRLEVGEIGVIEDGGVVGRLDLEAVLGAYFLDRFDPGGNRVVREVGDLGVDQDPEGSRVGPGRRGPQKTDDQRQECGDGDERRRKAVTS